MDPELQKALDAIRSTLKDAGEQQTKTFEAFKATVAENEKKRDGLLDDKLAKITKSLDQFEVVNAAITKVEERAKQIEEDRKAMQTQLDELNVKLNRPGALGDDEAKAKSRTAHTAFLDYCRYGNERADKMPKERLNVLTVSDDTGGGYLAVPDYMLEIIKAETEFSPMREYVRVTTTSNKSTQWPKRTGLLTASMVGEIESRSESSGQAYGMEDIPVHEMTAELYFSMANLEDSAFNLEAEFRSDCSEAFGVKEGQQIVSGTGVANKQLQGFLTTGAGLTQVNSGHATQITADGIIDLKYALKTAYARRATFAMNRSTLGKIRKLKDGTGNYLWMPGLAQGRPNTIDGDPYVEAPDMPDVAAGAEPIAYGDWRRCYILVDRLAMAIVRDGLTRASVGQVKLIARRRIGGQVVLAEAAKLMTIAA